ncbi:MAG: proton-conducting transporter membrane subunit, partial [Bacteroidales bacterium]
EMQVSTQSGAGNMAFILLAIGSFTKAGAFPFHSWIPDYAKSAHGISSAFMPASLDKLVGIYFLVLLCTKIFSLNQWLTLMLIIIGVLTIIIAVMMALIQHDYKKLLGYHAVSQVGYMVLGIGLGSPLGIAAGLFHMINNAVYKSGLFLSATSIHRITGTTDLDKTGGLAKKMPLTFVTTLIFALAISGIPPLNGFASKWMIYQGIVDFGRETGVANNLWIIWLALAVFGSALTLASFIKFIGGIFLGEGTSNKDKIHETGILQWLPKIFLALICVGFGAFATNYVVSGLFMPVSGSFEFAGLWDSNLLFWLVLVSVVLGFLIYLIGDVKNFRRADAFIGGEKAQADKGFPVTSFYDTIRDFRLLKPFYKGAEEKYFDLYDLTKNFVLWNNKILSRLHTGILTSYIFWIFGGLVIILLIMML